MDTREELIKGIIWTSVGKYSPMIISLGVTMILARLLSPTQFGTVALAMVFISFVQMLSYMGFSSAIIQRKDLNHNDLNNIFTLTCIIGFILANVFFFSSWLISKIYDNDELVTVCQILSVHIFFSAINMVPNALMMKNLRFKENAKRNFVLSFITAPLSIMIALLGGGLYSLLVTPVTSSIFIFLYNYHYYPVKVIIKLDWISVKKVLSFSIYQFLFQFINFFTVNADKLILGKYLGANNLGYYQKGYQLVQLPAGNITSIVYPVLHPVFSKYQDNIPLLFMKYKKLIKLFSSFVVPLTPLLYFCGPEIIRFFYGSNWEQSIPIFLIMSLALPIYVILPITGTFYQSSGNIRYLFITGLLNAAYTIFAIIMCCYIWGSIEAVAWSMTSASIFNFFCTYFIVYKFILNREFYKCIELFGGPILISLILSILLYCCNILWGSHVFINFIFKCLLYSAITITYVQLSKQCDLYKFITKYIKRKNHDNRIDL